MPAVVGSALVLLATAGCVGQRGDVIDLIAHPVAANRQPATQETAVALGETEHVAMSDFRFSPGAFTVNAGRTVRFVFTNTSLMPHQAVIGDQQIQDLYEAAMNSGKPVAARSGAAAVVVPAGGSGEITYTFSAPGTILLGCHEPGHWAAGMQATITVTP